MSRYPGRLLPQELVVIVLLATASKTYIGSVLFQTSAYTGAKQASRVPFWFRDLSRQNHLVPGHLIPFCRPGHLVLSFIMGFNSLMLFFYMSKFTFLNRLLDKKISFDQMHFGKFYHISCNTVLCRLFNSVNFIVFVCMYIYEYYYYYNIVEEY